MNGASSVNKFDLGFYCLMQALLAARNSAGVVFLGTFGALAYVLMLHGDLDALALDAFVLMVFSMITQLA